MADFTSIALRLVIFISFEVVQLGQINTELLGILVAIPNQEFLAKVDVFDGSVVNLAVQLETNKILIR